MADKHDIPDDEFDLFRSEMSDAKPIHYDSVLHTAPKPKAKKLQHTTSSDRSHQANFSDMLPPETVGNEEYLEYRGPGIQYRTFSKLRNGKIHIEAELDLHGFTLAMAEITLSEFLDQCQRQQIRCARIIHGKGWSSKDNKPVLKTKLNHWLRQNPVVLAFCSATIEDGGTGALYLLLKRTNTLPE
ncbi:MAG: Smr/MutS family protein [Gammaproteobacteria bacterium]|nr:Smr/MutS family protein [Gammaproteobacteria bacterium]MDT8371035.1 Smr/MutS family protein [Gammaproteobacteria bacterium]